MMDENIVNVISTIGFPIFACLGCGYIIAKLSNVILELSVTLKSIDNRLANVEDKVNDLSKH